MEPDVARALTDDCVAKIHPQPNSDAGKRALHWYNVVAFGSAHDARIDQNVGTKKRYGDLCRVAVKIFGFTQRKFEAHIKQFLDWRPTHLFLFGAELRRGSKKRRADQLELAFSAPPSDTVVKTTMQTYKLPNFLAEERFGSRRCPIIGKRGAARAA